MNIKKAIDVMQWGAIYGVKTVDNGENYDMASNYGEVTISINKKTGKVTNGPERDKRFVKDAKDAFKYALLGAKRNFKFDGDEIEKMVRADGKVNIGYMIVMDDGIRFSVGKNGQKASVFSFEHGNFENSDKANKYGIGNAKKNALLKIIYSPRAVDKLGKYADLLD